MFPLQGARVQSLVGELVRSRMLHGTAKTKGQRRTVTDEAGEDQWDQGLEIVVAGNH